jgi:hypothetical protein
MCVESVTETPVAATPPTVAVAPVTKFAPVIVTAVPPAAGPEDGRIAETAGEPGTGVGVTDGVKVRDGVFDAVRVGVTEGVHVCVGVSVHVGVRVFVAVAVPVTVAVFVRVAVAVDVFVGVTVDVRVNVGVGGVPKLTLTLSNVAVARTALSWLVTAIPMKTPDAIEIESEPIRVQVPPSLEL